MSPKDILLPVRAVPISPFRVAISVLLGLAILLDAALIRATLTTGGPTDFQSASAVVAAVEHGLSPLGVAGYRWSPLLVPVLVAIVGVGLAAWQVLQLAGLALLRDLRLAALTAASWPFWYNVRLGATLFAVVLIAVWAYRGSRLAAAAYLGLCLLTPRPIMLPLAVWLLWRHPRWLVPFVLAGLAELLALAVIGQLWPWLQMLGSTGPEEMANATNVGPSRLIGAWWIPIGLPLAAYLTAKRHLGLASLAASPYWLPYYLLFGLLEFVEPNAQRARAPGA